MALFFALERTWALLVPLTASLVAFGWFLWIMASQNPPTTLPKRIQNPLKIDVPKNVQFHIGFGMNFVFFGILVFLKIMVFL